MDQAVNVAVVRSDHRREAAAQALALIVDDLRARVTPSATVLPQLGPAHHTHAETLSATLDALVHAGAVEVAVRATPTAREQFRYRRELFGHPVRFTDPDEEAGGRPTPALVGPSCVVELRVLPRASWDERLRRGLAGLLPAIRTRSVRDGIPPQTSPDILVVDAFDARRLLIAGTDAAAVLAVANAECGLDRGTRLENIRVLGDAMTPGRGMRLGRMHSGPRFASASRRDRVA